MKGSILMMIVIFLSGETGMVCGLDCGGTCDGTGVECEENICYCKQDFWDTNCTTTCLALCEPPQVCLDATTCVDCSPLCTENQGECRAVSGGTPKCKCVAGYSGDACQTTKCSGDPDCLNDGTCTDELCVCAPGWEGDLCDQEVTVCDPACAAEEKCVEEDGSNVCKAKCANNEACKNNGTCVNELCNCAEGWTGDLCTDSGVPSVVPSVLSMALFMLVIHL